MVNRKSIPLPNQDDGESGSGLPPPPPNTYLLRLTPRNTMGPDPMYSAQDVENLLNDTHIIVKWMYSAEKPDTSKLHFHCVIEILPDYNYDDLQQFIRDFLDRYYVMPNGKRQPGFGGGNYNLQAARTLDQAVSYCSKDGIFKHVGYDPEYITKRHDESFQKKGPSLFKDEYQLLQDKFMKSDMTKEELMYQIILLKAKHDQSVDPTMIQKLVLSNMVKRDPDIARLITQNMKWII